MPPPARVVADDVCGGPGPQFANGGIRARLANGTLRAARRAWMGTAEGDHPCVCCGATIGAVDLEYEIKDRTALFAHLECFIIWADESAKLPVKRTARRTLQRVSASPMEPPLPEPADIPVSVA